MNIAVVSDTHLGEPTPEFKAVFEEHLATADVLLHLGDVTGATTYAWLEANHPGFHGVLGNCDDAFATGAPPFKTLILEGFTLGMAHGWGPRSRVGEAVLEHFGPGHDLVLYGHTHRPHWERVGDTWLLNPGSLALHLERTPSFARLTLEQARLPKVEHVYV